MAMVYIRQMFMLMFNFDMFVHMGMRLTFDIESNHFIIVIVGVMGIIMKM